MGNGYLYYYPEPDAGIQTLDIGGPFSSLTDQSEPQGSAVRGLGGQVFPTALGRFDRVGVTRQGISSEDTANALRTFEAYAESGRPWGVSLDHAKTWAGYCRRIRLRGETSIPTDGNAFAAYSSAGTLAANDYVVIESGYPEWTWEIAKVSAFSSNTITLASPGLRRSYRETPLMVRWYRFWPLLTAEARSSMVTTSNGVVWDFAVEGTTIASANPIVRLLSLTLETGTGGTKGGGKSTLNDLIGGQTQDDGLGKRGDFGGPFRRGGK